MLLRKIARPLLGTAFIASGADALTSPSRRAQASEPLVDSTVRAETVVQVAGAVQIAAGVALATGRAPRLASSVLAGTIVPTMVLASDFWNETDPARRALKQSLFVKDVGLLGGVLIAAADTEGRPALGWRARLALEQAQVQAHQLADRAAKPLHAAAEVEPERFTDRASALAHDAAERAQEVVDRVPVDEIRDRASQLAGTARAQLADTTQEIVDRAPEFAEHARDVATRVGEETAVRARRWRRQLAS